MALYDQHLHSRHSFDCKTEPRANVEAAIGKGLAGLTFTEHFDTHPLDWPRCVFDYADYSASIARVHEEFGSQIHVGLGIEICFQPTNIDFILRFLERHRFDLVLVSQHYFGGAAVHVKGNWEGVDAASATRQYLVDLLASVHQIEKIHGKYGRVFDVLSHFDVVKRYSHRYLGSHDMSPFAGLIDEILAACVAADLTPEINTSSLRQGLSETMPNADTIRRYASLGGKAISIGSDAHRPEDIGAAFDVASQMLREAGLEGVAVFKGRQRSVVPV